LLENHNKGNQQPLIDEDGNTIDTSYIMGRMREIGEKITQVSRGASGWRVARIGSLFLPNY
jgi:hypothetical protein